MDPLEGPVDPRTPLGAPASPSRESSTAMDDWRNRALCRGMDPDMWFAMGPLGVHTKDRPDVDAPAIAVCMECPVWFDCLDSAITQRIEYGVWGGLTWPERRDVLRELGVSLRSEVVSPETVDRRECTRCRVRRPVSDFSPNKGKRCGLNSRCRKCRATDARWQRQMGRST